MVGVLADEVRVSLSEVADPAKAEPMRRYMNSQMPFLGVQKPVLVKVMRPLIRGASEGEAITAAVDLWDHAEYREHRYAALLLLRGRPVDETLARHLIMTGAWWDYVDEVATKLLPAQVDRRAWASDDNMWIRRAAIISQVGRKQATDPTLLIDVIVPNTSDRRFWITKAIGWALRDYARTDPDFVRAFVASHDLAPLSVREATKHL